MHFDWNFLVDKPFHRDKVSFIEGVLMTYLITSQLLYVKAIQN